MNYGFVIDNDSCIGCHACSTACKSENEVPLGVYRTWVKYTEVGLFPDVTRNFQVTRCNHCANPPCARICPTGAMYQRDDGIVEFDGDECIGCKGCLQACPYDAIHIDPATGTAAKCHYCAHRVDRGMEPACVVVCPTHSIIAGDMDDPSTEISRHLATRPTTVRKPEQGTAPKLFYVSGSDSSMHPTAGQREPAGMIWADVVPMDGDRGPAYPDASEVVLDLSGDGSFLKVSDRPPNAQGQPAHGPIQPMPSRQAGQMVQYNAQHKVPWHWPVPAYLVTKGIGAGVPFLLALAALGAVDLTDMTYLIGLVISLVALGATTALLIADLERPERFLRILMKPQWKSWLTRGGFILIAFTNLVLGWLVCEALGVTAPRAALAIVTIPLSIAAAVYTAFLFAQAEGRDLWQSPLLPIHLMVQAVMVGAGTLAVVESSPLVIGTLIVATVLDVAMMWAELGTAHASEVAAAAARAITAGKYRNQLLQSVVLHFAALLLLLVHPGLSLVCVLVGLYRYEYAFVMAPQEVPNS
ncbi:MAG: polysulfide reductase NrfD [Proteobacteria bacterium]|nr:polysulfide reductase NrfD [Pseudomonadota bacterium]MCP4919916.1 polysulfide reductase NrfD [Pseudomonadota bacterium]